METSGKLGLVVLFATVFGAQGVWAAPGGNKGGGGGGGGSPPEIFAVVVDNGNASLEVSGSNLSGASAELGGVPMTGVTSEASAVSIPFSAAMASVVTMPGNYALSLTASGQTVVFPVYLASAIMDPTDTACPCQPAWQQSIDDALLGEVLCYVDTGTQVGVNVWAAEGLGIFPMTTQYDVTAKECAFDLNDPLHLFSVEQHNSCADFLRANFMHDLPSDTPNCF